MHHPFRTQHTNGYNAIADRGDDDDDDETVVPVPLVPHNSIRSRTNDNHGGKTKTTGDRGPLAAVFLTLTLLVGLALYAVGPFIDGGDRLRRSGGNLVDGTATSATKSDGQRCVPATDTFGAVSTTTYFGKEYPFETCYHLGKDKKRPDEANCCWTKSFLDRGDHTKDDDQEYDVGFFECVPDGLYGANYWHASYDSNPGTCGLPCQNVHEDPDRDS